MSTFFDESYYLKSKLAQLHSVGEKDADGNDYTLETLQTAIADAGMTPETHYLIYGRAEKLNPNAYFNESEYLIAKTNQVNSVAQDGRKNWTVDEIKTAIADIGLTPAEHYEIFGGHETDAKGNLINPSNAFDANAYAAAKLFELKATEPEKWAGKTAANVVTAIAEAGMSPIAHYALYGAAEANASNIPLVQTVPVVQRVENDPARVAVTGEIVPSNYNAPSAPPFTVTAKNAAPVAKPADVGGKADGAISPMVVVPAKPMPVPGDANYVPPPVGIVDTNANPVVLVPSATEDSEPTYGIVTDNGKDVSSVGADGKPTGEIIGKVDDDAGEVRPITPVTPDPTPDPEVPTPPTPSDTTAPDSPTFAATLAGDNVISKAELADGVAITGTAESGSTVRIVVHDENSETADVTLTGKADASGAYSLTLTQAQAASLTDGNLTLTATATDAAGNTSAAATKNLTLDTTPPNSPTFTDTLAGDNAISKAELAAGVAITGTAEAGSTVRIVVSDGDTTTADVALTGTADASGAYSLTLTQAQAASLTDGGLTLTATATDAAGNTSAATTKALMLDTIQDDGIPFKLLMTNPYMDSPVASVASVSEGGSGQTITLTFNKPVKAGSGYIVLDDAHIDLANVTFTDNVMRFTLNTLAVGDHTVSFAAGTVTDDQGNDFGALEADRFTFSVVTPYRLTATDVSTGGTAGRDLFTGTWGTDGALTANTSINGGGGSDALEVTLINGASPLTGLKLTSIEMLRVIGDSKTLTGDAGTAGAAASGSNGGEAGDAGSNGTVAIDASGIATLVSLSAVTATGGAGGDGGDGGAGGNDGATNGDGNGGNGGAGGAGGKGASGVTLASTNTLSLDTTTSVTGGAGGAGGTGGNGGATSGYGSGGNGGTGGAGGAGGIGASMQATDVCLLHGSIAGGAGGSGGTGGVAGSAPTVLSGGQGGHGGNGGNGGAALVNAGAATFSVLLAAGAGVTGGQGGIGGAGAEGIANGDGGGKGGAGGAGGNALVADAASQVDISTYGTIAGGAGGNGGVGGVGGAGGNGGADGQATGKGQDGGAGGAGGTGILSSTATHATFLGTVDVAGGAGGTGAQGGDSAQTGWSSSSTSITGGAGGAGGDGATAIALDAATSLVFSGTATLAGGAGGAGGNGGADNAEKGWHAGGHGGNGGNGGAGLHIAALSSLTLSGATTITGGDGGNGGAGRNGCTVNSSTTGNGGDGGDGGAGGNGGVAIDNKAGLQLFLSGSEAIAITGGAAGTGGTAGSKGADKGTDGFVGDAGAAGAGFSHSVTVDASQLTGKLTLEGSHTADTIIGGQGDDELCGMKGKDTLTGGAGKDTFVFNRGDSSPNADTADTITDFTSGTDKLKFVGLAAGSQGFGEVGNFTDFDTARTSAEGMLDGRLYAFATIGNDGYLFINNGSSGSVEEVIILTGVTSLIMWDIVAGA